MHSVHAAARAVFLDLHAAWIVAAILFRDVISFFALGAGEDDHWADIFLLGCHTFFLQRPRDRLSFTT
jgi:hypothetical protein